MIDYFLGNFFLSIAFIFVARIIDVSFATIRMILVVRGERIKAACIGFFEIILWVLVLNAIMSSLDNIWNLLAYALGYSSGIIVGGAVEEKLAIGIQHIQLITMKEPLKLADLLRNQGYGVTVVEGMGRDGSHYVVQVLLERKQVKAFSQTVSEWDEDVFMIVSDAKKYLGGVMGKSKLSGEDYAGLEK